MSEEYNYEECSGSSCRLCADYGRESDSREDTDDGGKSLIYLLTSKESVHYVGTTTTNMKHCKAQHRHSIKVGMDLGGNGEKFIEYYQSHNYDESTIKIIEKSESKAELLEKVKHFIKLYDSANSGLNSLD